MATLVYNGPECRRLKKGTVITVLPKKNSNQITPYDIEDALKKLGLEHDEVSYGRNIGDWETQEEHFKRMSSSSVQSDDTFDSSAPTTTSKGKELAKKGLKMFLKSCWNYFWKVAKGAE